MPVEGTMGDAGNARASLVVAAAAITRTAPVAAREAITIGFDPSTLVTSLDVVFEISAPAHEVAGLINPAHWSEQPFFEASLWLDTEPDPTTQACSGLFLERLDFHVSDELFRSVENHLYVRYGGWPPTAGRTPIECSFNLYSSVDDLLSIDRGWYRADPVGDDAWRLSMRKHVRFSDSTNAVLAPLLLAYWQEAAMAQLAERYDIRVVAATAS